MQYCGWKSHVNLHSTHVASHFKFEMWFYFTLKKKPPTLCTTFNRSTNDMWPYQLLTLKQNQNKIKTNDSEPNYLDPNIIIMLLRLRLHLIQWQRITLGTLRLKCCNDAENLYHHFSWDRVTSILNCEMSDFNKILGR